MGNRAVILVNVGTPDSPSVKDVRKYLSEFLNDPEVIDMPWLLRKLLVNLIIVPFRAPRSASLYRRLWTDKGSPLLVHLTALVHRVRLSVHSERQDDLFKSSGSDRLAFFGAMRYGNPSLSSMLKQVRQEGYDRITILPLYPQYASSTTGSVIELVNTVTGKWDSKPEIDIVKQFYASPAFIRPMADRVRELCSTGFDRMVFSYHGLPVSQVQKEHPSCNPDTCGCDEKMTDHGRMCYRAACYETSRLLAEALGLGREEYLTAFQSRFSKNWIGPFTDDTLLALARSGAKRVVIAAPSFTADCLETTIEIGEEYRKLFISGGGEELVVVPCLNEDLDVVGILGRSQV
jgi:ferrochelatase